MKPLFLLLTPDAFVTSPEFYPTNEMALAARAAFLESHRAGYRSGDGRYIPHADLARLVSVNEVRFHEHHDLIPTVEYYPLAPDGKAVLGPVDQSHPGGFLPIVCVRIQNGRLVNATAGITVGDIAGRPWLTCDEREIPEHELLFSG